MLIQQQKVLYKVKAEWLILLKESRNVPGGSYIWAEFEGAKAFSRCNIEDEYFGRREEHM